jgi:hypothetical protein
MGFQFIFQCLVLLFEVFNGNHDIFNFDEILKTVSNLLNLLHHKGLDLYA